jgi:hypothetical protein
LTICILSSEEVDELPLCNCDQCLILVFERCDFIVNEQFIALAGFKVIHLFLCVGGSYVAPVEERYPLRHALGDHSEFTLIMKSLNMNCVLILQQDIVETLDMAVVIE